MALFDSLKEVLIPYANKINEMSLYSPLAFGKRPTIPDNTDIDTILTPGEYKITTSTHAKTMTNLPSTLSGVLKVSTAVSAQTYYQTYRAVSSTGYEYTRTKASNNSEWSPWRRIALNDEFNSVPKNASDAYTVIASDTDLNTLTTPGEYKSTNASVSATLINSPFSGVGFLLIVMDLASSTNKCQIAIGSNANVNVYIRFITSGGTYSDWKKINVDIDADELTNFISSAGIAISDYASRITDLEEASGVGGEYLTPYHTEEQALYDKVNNDIDSNTLVFVVSADNHYRETVNSGANQVYHAEVMAKMAKRIRADAIINLGDIITQYMDSVDDPVYGNTDTSAEEVNTMRLAKMATAFQSTGVPFLYTLAHHEMYLHDNGVTSTDFQAQVSVYPYPKTKVLGLCCKGSQWLEEHHYSHDPHSAGYYVDFDDYKVRLMVFDSVGFTATGFSPDSIAFISEAFSSVPAGYKVLVCTHVATKYPGVHSSEVNNGDQVETIMQNFTSNGGVILAELHGHSHFDNVVQLAGIPYPYIGICCAENSWSTVQSKIDAGVQGNPVSYKYHASTYGAIGTYNEWLFDVVCVHPDTNTIKLFRFGIGSDRTVSLT